MTTSRRAVILVALTLLVLAVGLWSGVLKAAPLKLALLAGVLSAVLVLSDSRGAAFLLTILLGAVLYLELSQAERSGTVRAHEAGAMQRR